MHHHQALIQPSAVSVTCRPWSGVSFVSSELFVQCPVLLELAVPTARASAFRRRPEPGPDPDPEHNQLSSIERLCRCSSRKHAYLSLKLCTTASIPLVSWARLACKTLSSVCFHSGSLTVSRSLPLRQRLRSLSRLALPHPSSTVPSSSRSVLDKCCWTVSHSFRLMSCSPAAHLASPSPFSVSVAAKAQPLQSRRNG